MRGLRLERVYETPEEEGGCRVLVDCLWPRGLRKEKAAVDLRAKDVAPGNELRRWFGHRAERWHEFATRYREELDGPPARAEIVSIRGFLRKGRVTLLYAAHDEERNNAVVLRDVLRDAH